MDFRHPFLKYSLLVLLGMLLLFGGYIYGKQGVSRNVVDEDCHRTLSLLDQTLDCEKIENIQTRVASIEADVIALIEKAKSEKKVSRVGVFYRDLSTRRWFGVNADAEFYPASLAKLPLAMTYYKVSDLELAIFVQQKEDKNLK